MKLCTVTLTFLASSALADWQVKSRPDLAPPRLNITLDSPAETSRGYIFIAPFAGLSKSVQPGPRQAAPYIFRSDGELVWSGYGYYSIWSTNFHAGKWNDQDVFFSFEGDHNPGYGHGHGHVTVFDQSYEIIREVRAGGHRLMDKHEWRGGQCRWGGSAEQQWIVNAIFQGIYQIDITTGKLLFEWSSIDHVSPDESLIPLNPGLAGSGYNSSDAWDYFHINSVDNVEAGNYLISARDACGIHKINGTDGSIIWRLNGAKSDFKVPDNAKFCFQHHARWVSHRLYPVGKDEEIISLYDNSAHGSEDFSSPEIHTAPTSSGKILRLNTKTWNATLVQGYYPPAPYKLRSKSQGSLQLLPSGNVLIGWGSEGAFTEYSPNGTAIFHAFPDSAPLGTGVYNYCAYKLPWIGRPNEEPALVALTNQHGTDIYVSWNGDTETAEWMVEYIDETQPHEKRVVGNPVVRSGFETRLHIPHKHVQRVAATAKDRQGNVLRKTRVIEPVAEVRQYKAEFHDVESSRQGHPQVILSARVDPVFEE